MNNIKNILKLIAKGLFYPDNKLSLIPNWISASRTICGLLIPLISFFDVPFEVLFGTLSYAAISDFLDGRFARMFAHGETPEGAMLDAISDKIFSIFLMFFLIPYANTFAINLILEIEISFINGKILANGNTPKSNIIGRIKTWPLFISLVFGYLGLSLRGIGIDMNLLMNIASGFSLISVPLEIASAKKYLETYNKKDDYSLNENEISTENELQNIIEEKKNNKKSVIVLDKNKNVQAMVFEQSIDEDKKKLNKGKQKKIEF